jgi:hypothetical protein
MNKKETEISFIRRVMEICGAVSYPGEISEIFHYHTNQFPIVGGEVFLGSKDFIVMYSTTNFHPLLMLYSEESAPDNLKKQSRTHLTVADFIDEYRFKRKDIRIFYSRPVAEASCKKAREQFGGLM